MRQPDVGEKFKINLVLIMWT